MSQRGGTTPTPRRRAEAVHQALINRSSLGGKLSLNRSVGLSRSVRSSPGRGRKSASPSRQTAKRPSSAKRKASNTKRRVPHNVQPKDGRIDLSGCELKTLDVLGAHQLRLEFLYARDNFLRSFQGLGYMPNLKILDVSSNCLDCMDFLGVLPSLRELYLNCNSLTSLDDLPTLPSLEVLSVCQNEILSLKYMQPQPELRCLFLSHNHIASFDGLPAFPKIESLRTVGNPLERNEQFMLTAIIACGPTLRKINGQYVTDEDKDLAASFSAVTSIAIRYGAMIGDRDPQKFLFEMQRTECMATPLPLTKAQVVGFGQEGSELAAQFSFVWQGMRLDNVAQGFDDPTGLYFDFQWLRGDRSGFFQEIPGAVSQYYRIASEDVGCSLKVECTPVIDADTDDFGETVFAITDVVVAAEPEAVSATITGHLVEGETVTATTVYRGGNEGTSLFTWFRCPPEAAPELIARANQRTYTLTADDVDCTLRVEYVPVREDGAIGEAILGKSGVVEAATPTCREVAVTSDTGEFIETCVLRGGYTYFGGRQGNCVFRWLRSEKGSTQMFEEIAGATGEEYTTTARDVDRIIKFEVTPVSDRGESGLATSTTTPVIAPCPPAISNLAIVPHPDGPFLEAYPLRADASYFGGVEGRSQITWCRRHIDDDPDDWELMYDVRGPEYVPNLVDIGYVFRVEYLPARVDGKLGKPLRCASSTPIQACDPCIVYIDVEGAFAEGEQLVALATYLGGVEGDSTCAWYRSKDEEHEVFELIEGTENQMLYVPGFNDINRRLKFKITPVREDGVVGAAGVFTTPVIAMAEPKFIEGRVAGDLVERGVLRCEGLYYGGEEGPTEVKWFRMRGTKKLSMVCKGAWAYTLDADDVGFEITVEVRPVRCDGARGDRVSIRVHGQVAAAEPAVANLAIAGELREGGVLTVTGDYSGGIEGASQATWFRVHPQNDDFATPIGEGNTYTVQADDLESRLRVDYLPVREDDVHGQVASFTSPIVKPAPPEILALAFEGADASNPDASAPPPQEGVEIVPRGDYTGGTAAPVQQYAWYHARDGDKGQQVASTLTYVPTGGDVGKYLIFEWTPVRNDGEVGVPVAITTAAPVAQGPPTVTAVSLTVDNPEEPLSLLVGAGDYHGGVEGASQYAWHRVAVDDAGTEQRVVVDGATDVAYQPTPADFGHRLVFVYTPVRSDGVVGAPVSSESSHVLSFGPPQVVDLEIQGDPTEGEVVHASFQATENTVLETTLFQWLRNGMAIPNAAAATYLLSKMDIGCTVSVQVTPGDAAGVHGDPMSTSVGPVLPGLPRVVDFYVTGGVAPVHSSVFEIGGTYVGGEPGRSEVTWLRASHPEHNVFVPIAGANGSKYRGSADDYQAILKAVYLPVRSDGVRGEPQEATIGPLAIHPDMQAAVQANVERGETSWEVSWLRNDDGTFTTATTDGIILANNSKVKIRERVSTSSIKTRTKAPYSAQMRVILDTRDERAFTVFLKEDQPFYFRAADARTRDEICLTLRYLVRVADGSAAAGGVGGWC